MKSLKKLWVAALMLMVLGCVSTTVEASEYDYMVQEAPMFFGDAPSLVNGKSTISWYAYDYSATDDKITCSAEVEFSKNKDFSGATQYTSKENKLVLDQAVFGTDGGKFYLRVRTVINVTDTENVTLTSPWSETQEYVYIKINKKNFPGMYKLLKNGGSYNGEKKVENLTYDNNKDSWLDPQEVKSLTSISAVNKTKKVKGAVKIIKPEKVTSFQGIEYLPNVVSITLYNFAGTKIDLAGTKVENIFMNNATSKKLTVNAPSAKFIHIATDDRVRLTKADFRKCSEVVELDIQSGGGMKTIKLPKNKERLKILSLSGCNIGTLDLNAYKNLQQLYVYEGTLKGVKVNKCKNLRYVYFYFCNKINKLDLKSNKQLRGVDIYSTTGLTKSTIKKPKKAKLTFNKGKWWYSTKAFKKDMKNLYD